MKVLLYTYDIMKIGGIETSFYNLAQYLKSKGYEVGVRYTVIAPMQLERYKKAGIDVSMQKKETCDILFIGSVWRRPKQIISKVVVQQVHADWSDEFWNDSPEAKKLLREADLESDAFAPVSNSAAGFVAEHTRKPIVVMNNLAPKSSKINRKKSDKLVIGAFTRMSTEKGLKNYEALRDRLKDLNIDAELRVYTNGIAPEGWIAHEPVPDIRTELRELSFVASLADTESFGYTIAEANSCGVPCIIKQTNSTDEFYDNKSNIILSRMYMLSEKDLKRKIKVNYTLCESSEKSIDKAMKQIEKLKSTRTILKCLRTFKDLESGNQRYMGEIFTVSNKRAKELLKHELNLVSAIIKI